MKLHIAWIGKTKDSAIQSLTDDYLKRIARYAEVEGVSRKNEDAVLQHARRDARSRYSLILLDSRGKQLSSEELAKFLADSQSRSVTPLLFAIGPADGFTEEARKSASLVLSLGRMTLAHELARIVLLEQIYRAFTIWKGHPYHLGH